MSAGASTVGIMSAQQSSFPEPGEPYQVIHLGGQAAAIVPLPDLRRLQAVERRAPSEVIELAEIETTLAAHREWVIAGRPGAVSHEQAMAELLAEP
jgi:hypothetical protein